MLTMVVSAKKGKNWVLGEKTTLMSDPIYGAEPRTPQGSDFNLQLGN